MGMTTLIALVGNIQLSLPGHEHNVFSWLEAIVPPLIVLSTAYILKGQLLETIEQRHATERAYQSARADWQVITTEPEQLTQWTQFYANALQDALRKANARRKETLAGMTQADWRLAVYREMQADLWFSEPEPDEQPATSPLEFAELSSRRINGNGARPKVAAAVRGTA
jgi:hypothetical protein